MAKPRMDLASFVGKLLEQDDVDSLGEGVRILAQAVMEILSSNKTFSAWAEIFRRRGRRRRHGRPARPSCRGHRLEGGQLSPQGQGKGGHHLRSNPLRVSSFQPAYSVRFQPALTAGLRAK